MAKGRWSNGAPPYEVMRGSMRGFTADPASNTNLESDHAPTMRLSQLLTGGSPVVMRLPRGFVLMGAVALLGSVMFSYWIGHWRGYRRGQSQDSPTQVVLPGPRPGTAGAKTARATGPVPTRLATVATRGRQAPGTIATLPVGPTQRGNQDMSAIRLERSTGTGDPRQSGLSYFVLVHSDERYARRVVQFLWQEGVAAAAIQRHNGRPFMVVTLQGFTAQQKGTADFRAYQRFLRDLGRAWETNYDSTKRWDDLYPSLYKASTVYSVIRKVQS